MAGDYGRPIAVGIVMALVVVVAFGTWLALSGQLGTPQEVDHVVVVLVTPDEEGVQLPQAMCLYELGRAGVDPTFIDVDLEVTLPGSSYTRLRDAYPFGGGDLLVSTWADRAGVEPPEWILVTEEAWLELTADDAVTLDMPADSQVFDGSALYSFDRGVAAYSGAEITALLKGVDYLEEDDRSVVRAQLSEELARLLSAYGDGVSLRTSLPDDLLGTWLIRLGS